jgi:hypothetical protein
MVGYCEVKSASLTGNRGKPDGPAVVLDNSAAHRQANTRAGVFILVVQALENLKNHVLMLRLNANAVVGH